MSSPRLTPPRQQIEMAVQALCSTRFPDHDVAGLEVKPCTDARFGDFQSNAAMIRGKQLRQNPRELAQELAEALAAPLKGLCGKIEVAGPGFINFFLKPEACALAVSAMGKDGRLGVPLTSSPRTIVVDFSSPNVAKEMHVGHIRSTILGAAIASVLRFQGHRVITDNHLGDWGTQFGKILVGYKRFGDPALLETSPVAHLEDLYRRIHEAEQAHVMVDGKKTPTAEAQKLAEEVRLELVKLQQGDAENLRLWRQFVDFSLKELDKIYTRLGVKFDYVLGESAYNDRLASVVEDLERRGIARRSEGAVCVFFEDEKVFGKDPFVVRKSDGGYLYATTDLATLQYRQEKFGAEEVLYVTDGRQQLHFRQLFETARRWGFNQKLEHVWFGSILGQDKKPLKTRDGAPIKLRELLDEAERRASAIIAEKRADWPEEKRLETARIVGLGALKYADLCQNRNLDYVFDWEKLMAFDGNTAPYVQNACVRIRSIFRKGETEASLDAELNLLEPAELDLAKKLLAYPDIIASVAEEHRPHHLCVYLFDLATCFHGFYEKCPILKSEEPVRGGRLLLCEITLRVLRGGLALLGIGVVEEM